MKRRQYLGTSATILFGGCMTTSSSSGGSVPEEPIAPVIDDSEDSWNAEYHDPNWSNYNRGGSGPEEEPSLKYRVENKVSPISDSNSVYAIDNSIGGKLLEYDLETGDASEIVERNGMPFYKSGQYLVTNLLTNVFFLDLESRSWHGFFESNQETSQLQSVCRYDDLFVLVHDKEVTAVTARKSGVSVEWNHTAEYAQSFGVPFHLNNGPLVPDDEGVWRLFDLENGEVIEQGDNVVQSKKLEDLSTSDVEAPLDRLRVGDYTQFGGFTDVAVVKSGNGEVWAESLESGNQFWSYESRGTVHGIAGNQVFVGEDGGVTTLDADTGEKNWHFESELSRFDVIPVGGRLLLRAFSRGTEVWA